MKQKLDLQIIKTSLIMFVIIITTGLSAIYISEEYRTNMQRFNNDEQQRLSSIQSKYSTALSEIQMLKRYMPQYEKLITLGFLGEENRLNWIEAVRKTATKFKFQTVNYNINAQQQYKALNKLPRGRFKLLSSEMSLRFDAMHELDLINLINGLEEESVGLFSPQKCRMERIREQLNFSPGNANFNAECSLQWFTARIDKKQ